MNECIVYAVDLYSVRTCTVCMFDVAIAAIPMASHWLLLDIAILHCLVPFPLRIGLCLMDETLILKLTFCFLISCHNNGHSKCKCCCLERKYGNNY